MPIKDMQKDVDDWTGQFKIQYWPPHEILAHVMEGIIIGMRKNEIYFRRSKKDW